MTADTRATSLRSLGEGPALEGARAVIERNASRIAMALRRVVPALVRRGVKVIVDSPQFLVSDKVAEGCAEPTLRVPFSVEPWGSAGFLLVDEGASSLLLDAVLGGDGQSLPELANTVLTGAQRTLLFRVARQLVDAFSQALEPALGARFVSKPEEMKVSDRQELFLALPLRFDVAGRPTRLVLALPPEVARALRREPKTSRGPNPEVALALTDVFVEARVELVKKPFPLRQLLALRVGDVLDLGVPLGAMASATIEGKPMFIGRPTAVGGHVALRIEDPQVLNATTPEGHQLERGDT